MPANSNDKLENRVIETSNRLRLIQVDFADESDQTRAEYLRDEIERALKAVLPQERNEFLERLLARFCAGKILTTPVSVEQPVQSSPSIEEDKLTDPGFLAGSLAEMMPALSAEQKELFANTLHQAGLPTPEPQASHEYSQQTAQQLNAGLDLGAEQTLDINHLMESTVVLSDFVFRLEPLVWNTWRTLSPRSNIRPPNVLKKTMAQFVCGESNVPRGQIDRELKLLQRLIAAIITAVSRVGSQFAKHHLAKFSPAEIEALVRMEHGSVFVSHEVKCWRKYLELADKLNEDSIEAEIRKAIVGCVESLMKGTAGRQP